MKRQKTRKKTPHIHQYERTTVGTSGTYMVMACTLPDCYHYVPMQMAIGKECRCYRCGNPFLLTPIIVNRLVKPHCNRCFKGYDREEDARKVLRDLETFRMHRRASSAHDD